MVEVAVLAKNMTKERVDIQIDKQRLRVVIRDADGEQEYELDVELYGEVSHCNPLPLQTQQLSSQSVYQPRDCTAICELRLCSSLLLQ